MPALRLLIVAVAVALLGGSGGCSSAKPLTPEQIASTPPLPRIDAALRRTMQHAFDHPEESWHSGWFGNTIVNLWGGSNRGLCWQWQQRVYAGVRSTVVGCGWQATGVQINRGKPGEHHAVIVFDPRRVAHDDLLTQPEPRHGYVLDAWTNGLPEIYGLDEWRNVPLRITVEWELQDLTMIDDLPNAAPMPEVAPASPRPAGAVGRIWSR